MQPRSITLAGFLVGAVAGAALAHGPQTQITFNPTTGKIETRQIISTDASPTSISPLARVYVSPLLPISGTFFLRPDATPDAFTGAPLYNSSPGLAYQYESFLPGTGWAHSGSSTRPNLQGTSFSYEFTDGLKIWNGAAFVDPGSEQLQIERGGTLAAPAATAVSTDSSPFASLALTAVGATASANPHSTVRWRLLGDGNSSTASSDDGVYLASLRLVSTAVGVSPSDPFFMVMYKNVDPSVAQAAAASLGFAPGLVQTYALVPEPAGLVSFGLAALLLRRKAGR